MKIAGLDIRACAASAEDTVQTSGLRGAGAANHPLMSNPVAIRLLPEALRYGRGQKVLNSAWFDWNCCDLELLAPPDNFAFGLVGGLPIENGLASLPDKPGLGREPDWDLIENTTNLVLR